MADVPGHREVVLSCYVGEVGLVRELLQRRCVLFRQIRLRGADGLALPSVLFQSTLLSWLLVEVDQRLPLLEAFGFSEVTLANWHIDHLSR